MVNLIGSFVSLFDFFVKIDSFLAGVKMSQRTNLVGSFVTFLAKWSFLVKAKNGHFWPNWHLAKFGQNRQMSILAIL